MTDQHAATRAVLAIGGNDRVHFLQGLVTNDVSHLADGPIYAALLSPQGKYLADFFLVEDADRILLDVATSQAAGLLRRLSMYRLRADVSVAPTELGVQQGVGTMPPGAWQDPRHPSLGWRRIAETVETATQPDWAALRVAAGVPESGIELIPDDSYILECGFERLHGVDFRKGCYVGQEVTARMKHKTALRKGLVTVEIAGAAPVGTEITSGGKSVGTLYTQSGGRALAYLRFDRAQGPMQAADAVVTWDNASTPGCG